MPLIDSGTFEFADGGTGHVCDLGSAPSAGQWDVFGIGSNTVVASVVDPTGGAAFGQAVDEVTNQGAYLYVREATAGEGQTVTITTSGNHNTQVQWQRWGSDLVALDQAAGTQANASSGTSTPPHSTGVMSDTDEVVIAFAAVHSIGTANQSGGTWMPSPDFVAVTESKQGSGATGVYGAMAYMTGAGTDAESPAFSWTGDGAFNRYILTVTFTAIPADDAVGAGGPVVSSASPTQVSSATGQSRIVSSTQGGRL